MSTLALAFPSLDRPFPRGSMLPAIYIGLCYVGLPWSSLASPEYFVRSGLKRPLVAY